MSEIITIPLINKREFKLLEKLVKKINSKIGDNFGWAVSDSPEDIYQAKIKYTDDLGQKSSLSIDCQAITKRRYVIHFRKGSVAIRSHEVIFDFTSYLNWLYIRCSDYENRHTRLCVSYIKRKRAKK